MPDTEKLTLEEARAKAANERQAAAEYLSRAEALEKEFGFTPSRGNGDVGEKISREERDAELFGKLTPGQLMELYQKDRPRWQEIMDAREALNTKRLFGRMK